MPRSLRRWCRLDQSWMWILRSISVRAGLVCRSRARSRARWGDCRSYRRMDRTPATAQLATSADPSGGDRSGLEPWGAGIEAKAQSSRHHVVVRVHCDVLYGRMNVADKALDRRRLEDGGCARFGGEQVDDPHRAFGGMRAGCPQYRARIDEARSALCPRCR